VRTVAVVTVLCLVLTASALDLALGMLWVAALMGVLFLRRRVRVAPALVLLVAVAVLVWGGRVGWFTTPAPVSYAAGWMSLWGFRSASTSTGDDSGPRIASARERLATLSRDELRLTGPEIEQRAGSVIALSRRIEPLRGAAPREAAAVEMAARRLARTLAATEFRDLEARRTAVAAHFGNLDRRLATARDENEVLSILREADPVAMAQLSLRPVREDLASAAAAVDALVGAIGGGVPTATATATTRVDEGRGEVRWEVRYAVAGAPGVRLLRLETRAFRGAAPTGARLSLGYEAGGEALRPAPPGGWLELEPAPRGVTVVVTWTEPVVVRPVNAALRMLTLEEVVVGTSAKADDVLITAALDGHPGLEIPLFVRLPQPRLGRAVVPSHALYFASRAGRIATAPDGESWEAADEGAGPLRIELLPRTVLLRNPAFGWTAGYLYRPNLGTVVAVLGFAALTLVLIRRPRPADGANRGEERTR
jgi:hypothetical protein